MMISAPVLAQEAPQQGATSPQAQQAAPAQPNTETDATPAETAAPAQESAAAATADQGKTQAAPAQSAEAAPAAGQPQQASATQIAQIVETEFPNYDGDKDGEITKDEFGKWMVALRSASEPGTNAQSAEVQTWVGNAFASADADKSTKVSKSELTSFLSKGAS
ncbi:hypothetical protein [Sphingomonas sp. Y38-1Y]|uniref:hypothetical protein n=1 Tax=Sphingomonas sp. Y38-1Y TaxID=3078265 RepID=UPI0028E2F1F6|nr:hypothetical protein [Sphingomonas sp. Y38-1Y]